jgi:transposase
MAGGLGKHVSKQSYGPCTRPAVFYKERMTDVCSKKFSYFVGIDVSRSKLDMVVLREKDFCFHRVIKNDQGDITAFIEELTLLPGFTLEETVFCMEQTGIYCNYLLSSLAMLGASVVLENALKIKDTAGRYRAKSDKADAIRIAQYVYKNRDELKIWIPKRGIIEQLSHLASVRGRLVGLQNVLKVPLKEQASFINTAYFLENALLCKSSLQSVESDIRKADARIKAIIKADKKINRLMKIMLSVPGIGQVTALQFLITTNEFINITEPKKFACYAGVAPFPTESGTVNRKRKVSHFANKRMKSLLHVCALAAKRSVPEFKEYFDRKHKVEGKPKLLVYNALRNKLILIVFTCVKQDRCYRANYRPQEQLVPGN